MTIVVDEHTVIQVDINHRQDHNLEDDPRDAVVDRLVEVLPRLDGAEEPDLSVLAITHHDEDHCSGFPRLLDEVNVCEIWITLRSFIEHKNGEGLTDAGQAVYDEACKRRKAEIAAFPNGRAPEGQRLRVIGNAAVLNDPDWQSFPTDLLTSAGQLIPDINGIPTPDGTELFVHTPFHTDTEDGDRNSSSLGLHVTLRSGDCEQRFLLLGDLAYEQIDAFLDKTEYNDNHERLDWDVLLAPHHGSRNAFLRKEGDDWVKADAVRLLNEYAAPDAKIIVSGRPIGDVGENDTDPPHEEALELYRRTVGAAGLLLTADHPSTSGVGPVIIEAVEGRCGESGAERLARYKTVTPAMMARIRPGEEAGIGGDQEFACRVLPGDER